MNRPVAVLFAAMLPLLMGTSPAPNPNPPTLSSAIEDWIVLLERDDARVAAERWAANDETAKAIKDQWGRLRECHKQYDYRKWLDGRHEPGGAGAAKIGDGTKFTVGGHSFGHLHTNWEKTDKGWRVTRVWMCR